MKQKVIPSLKEKQGQILLTEAIKRWKDHQLIIKYLLKIFHYLDRFYTKNNGKNSLREVSLDLYYEKVYLKIKTDLAQAIYDKIQSERDGEITDRSILKDGISLFIEMAQENRPTTYEDDFEKKLLHETELYYSRQSSKWIEEMNCVDYMKKVDERIASEERRCLTYLAPQTKPKLMNVVYDELIRKHQMTMINMENCGMVSLLQTMAKEDLSRMFKFFEMIQNVKPMADKLEQYIREEGIKLLESFASKSVIDVKGYVEG